MFSNTFLLANRVLKQLIRDHRTIGMIIVMPILITFIFGYAIGGQVQHIPVAIIVQDQGFSALNEHKNLGQEIFANLHSDSTVKLFNASNFQLASKNVDNSKYNVAILIPVNFTQDLLLPLLYPSQPNSLPKPVIHTYVDDSEPSIVVSVLGALQDAINKTINENTINGHSFGIQVTQAYAHGIRDVNSLDVTIPGVIALILNYLVLLFSTLLLVRENTYGTRSRLLASPIRPREIIMGYSIALGILSLFISLSIMVISVFAFHATVHGNILELFLCILIFGLGFVFLGVFLSNFARNELQAVQMGPLIAFPSMALSGFLVPVKFLPSFLQPLSKIVPMYYGIELFRGIMLKGYSILDMLPDFLAIVGAAVFFLILALISIRPTQD